MTVVQTSLCNDRYHGAYALTFKFVLIFFISLPFLSILIPL